MKTYVLYHKNCADGMGAAWAAYQCFGDTAEYIAVAYQEPVPHIEDGSLVYMVDFSFKKDVLNAMAEKNKIIILDHHKTAKEDLSDATPVAPGEVATGKINAWFDMDHSGAALTWKFFFPGVELPTLLKYIQDRDLWKWELDKSKEISAWIASNEWSLGSFQYMFVEIHKNFESCVKVGSALLRAQEQTVEMMSAFAKVYDTAWGKCALVNATAHWSELGNYLCKKFPEAQFSVSYYFDESTEKVKFSGRSVGDFDVSAIAKEFGGGGHKNAAGFSLASDHLSLFFGKVVR